MVSPRLDSHNTFSFVLYKLLLLTNNHSLSAFFSLRLFLVWLFSAFDNRRQHWSFRTTSIGSTTFRPFSTGWMVPCIWGFPYKCTPPLKISAKLYLWWNAFWRPAHRTTNEWLRCWLPRMYRKWYRFMWLIKWKFGSTLKWWDWRTLS